MRLNTFLPYGPAVMLLGVPVGAEKPLCTRTPAHERIQQLHS